MKNLFLIFLLFLGQNILAQDRFVKENETVFDTDLKLHWQDEIKVSTTKLSLDNSVKHCKNLRLNGFTNWRLPTYEELLSIGDYDVYKPTLNKAFNHSASGHFWSIIYKRVAYSDGWESVKDYYVRRIYFSDGVSYDNDRTGKAYVRCVRQG